VLRILRSRRKCSATMGKGRSRVVAAMGWGHTNTTVTETTYGEKMGNAAAGVCVGPVLYIVALILVGWNEYHTVQVSKVLEEAEKLTEPADCNNIDGALDGKLVYLSCPITGIEALRIPAPFSASPPPPPPAPPGTVAPPPPPGSVWAEATALALTPHVEYFAWKEYCSSRSYDCTGPHSPVPDCRSSGSSIEIKTCTNQAEWVSSPQTVWQNKAPTLQQAYDQRENGKMSQTCSTIDYRGYQGHSWWQVPPPGPPPPPSSTWWTTSAPTYSCSLGASLLPEQTSRSARVGTAYPLDGPSLTQLKSSAPTVRCPGLIFFLCRHACAPRHTTRSFK
jgi:hypothetical protein